jgi:hypothetical protein
MRQNYAITRFKALPKNSLEKRLSIDFNFKDLNGAIKTAMKCEGAYLSGQDDIRAWGQQIGKQMNDQKLLDFKPLPTQKEGSPTWDDIEKCFFKPYHLIVLIDSDTEGLPTLNERIRSKIRLNQMLLWSRQNGMVDEWVESPIQNLPSSPASARS